VVEGSGRPQTTKNQCVLGAQCIVQSNNSTTSSSSCSIFRRIPITVGGHVPDAYSVSKALP
jgi:hypothetical protein